MPSKTPSLASLKSRMVLAFWYQLMQVVLYEKRLLNNVLDRTSMRKAYMEALYVCRWSWPRSWSWPAYSDAR